MLVDHRTYRIKPGKMQAHLDLYEQYGYPTQTKHLGKPLAYMFTESGEMNTIVHIWAYENAADREKRRAAMVADPDWQAYLEEKRGSGQPGKPDHETDDPGEIRTDRKALK